MMLPGQFITTVTGGLRRSLSALGSISTASNEPLLVSTTVAAPVMDPLSVFRQAHGHERVFWQREMEDFALVAIGSAIDLTGDGENRCSQVAQAWRRLGSRALVEVPDDYPLAAPVCLGGFAFDPGRSRDRDWGEYPDALLILPRLLLSWSGGSCWLTTNVLAASDADALVDETAAMLSRLLAPSQVGYEIGNEITASGGAPPDQETPRAATRHGTLGALTAALRSPRLEFMGDDAGAVQLWKDTVSAILDDIRGGTVQKQVLARRVRIAVLGATDPVSVLERLRAGYGTSCTIFALTRGDTCFLGASPERLVRVDGHVVHADGLAGSTARGSTAEEDRSMGLALLASEKERHEHALVVRALRDGLEPFCERLSIPERPLLLGMPNVQHLYTPVEGVLRSGTNILDLVERLHPTPTVGGVPRAPILSRIRLYEPFDRGWYAGPIGWIDANDGGEFAVGIRSALVKGIGVRGTPAMPTGKNPDGNPRAEVLLYAGCGIVAGSDPHAEYQESCLKLRPLLGAVEELSSAHEHPGAATEQLAHTDA